MRERVCEFLQGEVPELLVIRVERAQQGHHRPPDSGSGSHKLRELEGGVGYQ